MDPLSITASAMAVAGGVGNAVISVTKFIRQIRDARTDLLNVISELGSLEIILQLLADETKQRADSSGVPEALAQQIQNILANCDKVVQGIQRQLEKYENGNLIRDSQWAIYGRDDMDKLRSSLEAHKTALDFALQMLHFTLVRDIKQDTVEIHNVKNDTSHIIQNTEAIKKETGEIRALIDRMGRLQHSTATETAVQSQHTLHQYLDGLSAYAGTVYQESLADPTDYQHYIRYNSIAKETLSVSPPKRPSTVESRPEAMFKPKQEVITPISADPPSPLSPRGSSPTFTFNADFDLSKQPIATLAPTYETDEKGDTSRSPSSATWEDSLRSPSRVSRRPSTSTRRTSTATGVRVDSIFTRRTSRISEADSQESFISGLPQINKDTQHDELIDLLSKGANVNLTSLKLDAEQRRSRMPSRPRVELPPPLEYAVSCDNCACVEVLLQNGATCLSQKTKSGQTLLQLAIMNDCPQCVKSLVQAKAEVNVTRAQRVAGGPPLHIAVSSQLSNAATITGILIEAGAEVNQLYFTLGTPLVAAIRSCTTDEQLERTLPAIWRLLEGGANPNIECVGLKLYGPRFALCEAMNTGIKHATVQSLSDLLVPRSANLSSTRLELIRQLLLYDADFDTGVANALDKTALSYAARRGHYDVMELLLRKDNTASLRRENLVTALDAAICYLDIEAIEMLLRDPQTAGWLLHNRANLPLHRAIWRVSELEMTKALAGMTEAQIGAARAYLDRIFAVLSFDGKLYNYKATFDLQKRNWIGLLEWSKESLTPKEAALKIILKNGGDRRWLFPFAYG